MIPFHDENPTKTFPILTILLISSNIFIFFWGLGLPMDPMEFYYSYGLVPYQLVNAPVANYSNIYSSMFLHSGLGHLAGNMLYMWIFGNNIEDVLGKVRFILFYLICGTLAAFCHIAMDTSSTIPMVGASGAISGILGAYMILFPNAKVKTLIFLGFFITIIRIRAVILLALWMLFQIISVLAAPEGGGGGVAWSAHVGGFLVGMALILPFKKLRI
ncbi:MAG: rhomboid family intramembrane serine protease [Nitrospinaceae bacterium]